jgi:hypothetical protein
MICPSFEFGTVHSKYEGFLYLTRTVGMTACKTIVKQLPEFLSPKRAIILSKLMLELSDLQLCSEINM